MKYIYNDEKDLRRFREVFGAAWEKAAELEQRLGAFMLLQNEGRAVLDENAARCFGVPEDGSPVCSELKELVATAGGSSPDLDINLVDGVEGVTAGFVRLTETDISRDIHYRLCTQRELADLAARSPDAVIMMLSVTGAEASGEELESCIFSAADAIFAELPEGATMTRLSENDFRLCLPEGMADPEGFASFLAERVRGCTLRNPLGCVLGEEHSLGLAVGICSGRISAAYKMHGASFALYEALSGKSNGIRVFYPEKYESRKAEYDSIMKFSRLINDNLFIYHFQPIVSSVSGEIVAYEALMRSSPTIGYGPLEILDIAAKRGKLYDIELATLRNALAALSENQSFFDDRKLFINSIPSQMLTQEDYNRLYADYGELLEKTVIEFTEHSEVSDEVLDVLKKRLAFGKMQLAIDDYGTGYSNTTNLMRYSPDYVKIDRSLIASIEDDPKRQALISGIIDFAHSTGCMALAEGVETIDEVRTVINLNIDLLQGYYVSRPKPVLINEISESVREEIVKINLEAQRKQKIYRAQDGDQVDLNVIALEKYTDIFIEGGNITLFCEKDTDRRFKLPITFKENCECSVTLRNICIEPERDTPAITLSNGSSVRLICEGVNKIYKGMILVPEGSDLRISGMGDLSIDAETMDCYGIGNCHNKGFGNIIIDMDGRLDILVNGENGIGIGGGRNGQIRAEAGSVSLTLNGTNIVGIGTFEGDTDIALHDCGVFVTAAAASAVCLGSMYGSASLNMSNIAVGLIAQGNHICAAGSLGNDMSMKASDMKFTTELRGRTIMNIGSVDSTFDCSITNAALTLYSEGHSVTGIGDRTGGGSVDIVHSELNVTFLTGDSCIFACPDGTLRLDNVVKSIKLNE